MKPSRKDWLLWLCALAMSLVLLAVTRSSKAQSLELPYRGVIGKRTIPFAMSFVDFQQRQHILSCEIPAAGHRQEIDSVGFTTQQRTAWLNPRMYKRAHQELSKINLQLATLSCAVNVFPSESVLPGRDWGIQKSFACSSNERGFAEEGRKSVDKWIEHLDGEVDKILEPFYESHNVLLVKDRSKKPEDKVYINYAAVIQRASPLLTNCAHGLYEEGRGTLDANIFASFLQQIAYVKLPSPKGEYHVRDFLVPTQVLVDKKGDCDSKSAAFCALWRNYSKNVILLLSRKHALVGYKAPPTTPLQTYPVKGIRYILCDVSGINRNRCGVVPAGDYLPVF